MSPYTEELRQQIIEEFCSRHDGRYDAAEFLDEVRRAGPKHPAYDWFEFDVKKAALQYNLSQARQFAQGLKVTYEVKKVAAGGPIKLITSAPLVISPLASRHQGGGYVLTDLTDKQH